jgi:putative DNA primase/helicase
MGMRCWCPLFDAVSAALRNINEVHIPLLPRMAEFAKWVTAAEDELPWQNGAFIKEYKNNRESLVDTAIEADLVATAVLDLANRLAPAQEWSGTPSELLNALEGLVPESNQRLKLWPKQANVLSNRLRRAQTFLRHKGIEIERSKSGDRNITVLTILYQS